MFVLLATILLMVDANNVMFHRVVYRHLKSSQLVMTQEHFLLMEILPVD